MKLSASSAITVTLCLFVLPAASGSDIRLSLETGFDANGRVDPKMKLWRIGRLRDAITIPCCLPVKVLGTPETKDGPTKGSRRWDLPGGKPDQFQHFVPVKFKDGERYVGQHEVTQELYEAVVGKNPSKHKGAGVKHLPVEGVSAKDAEAFCRKLSAKDKNFNFRLPTLDEMEFLIADGNADGKGGHLSVGACCNVSETQFVKVLRDKPALKAAVDTATLVPEGGKSLRGLRLIAVPK